MAQETFRDLEKAACCLLQIIKDTPELDRNTKVAIAGDMAVRKYLPDSRQHGAVQSIDLITNSATSASLLRKKLLHHPMSPLTESSDRLLYYQTSSPPTSPPPSSAPAARSRSAGIEVRITPEMLCPFLPGAARLVHELNPSPEKLPYISLNDLIVFKMDACGLRDSPQGKQQEARDAAALLEVATEHCALDLNRDQARVVDECLPDILRHSAPDRQNKAWWQARLMGKCDPDARKEAKDVLADLIESMSLSESNKRSSGDDADSKRWSLNLSSRTSSSSSKTSIDSMASGFSGGGGGGGGSSSSNISTCSSPTTTGTNSPDLPRSPRSPHDLTCAIPQRPRKFSTSQNSPTKGHARKKSTADKGGSKRHSQILGGLPSGGIAQIAQLLDDSSPGSPGLTLTGRFESTPEVDHGFSTNGSYF